ncbi:winged helix-turn-helix domain-containing protein [Arthrobacter alpinus]|nr:winged helix-turn-helix domain-containing protein [Arthrobacter alpinus]
MLPDGRGEDVLVELMRFRPSSRVLVLSSMTQVATRVGVLEGGAVDFLAKPFANAELLARINARLRAPASTVSVPRYLRRAGVEVDVQQRELVVDGRRISLTQREFVLLAFLLQRAPEPCTRAELLERVWGRHSTAARTSSTSVCVGCDPNCRTIKSKRCEMSDIGSRFKIVLAATWAVFAAVNCYLTFSLPGRETIPFHLVWASFALVYGLCPWPRRATLVVVAVITMVTGVALVRHAMAGTIEWEECTEIVLMGTIISILIWHVNRQWAAQARLRALQEADRHRSEQRENAARFGSHEVRTRLTIARGYAQLIADQSAEPTVREDAELVVAELIKASALATNLLTLVRVVEPSAPNLSTSTNCWPRSCADGRSLPTGSGTPGVRSAPFRAIVSDSRQYWTACLRMRSSSLVQGTPSR